MITLKIYYFIFRVPRDYSVKYIKNVFDRNESSEINTLGKSNCKINKSLIIKTFVCFQLPKV